VLPKESGITGRVEDERGKPVAAADIQVVPTMSEGGRSGRTSSSADGLFKLSDVPAGKYKLWVTTADYMDSETLELTVFEESKSSVLVQLIRTGTIGGQVLGAVSRESLRRLRVYGTPVGGAASVMPDERSAPSGYSAVLRSDRTVRAFTVPIGESGTFEVTGVAPGDYYMCVSGDSGGSAAGTIKRRVLVSVLGGEKIDVALPIPILGTIYGFVSTASEYAATDTPVVLCKRTANGWGEQLRASVDAAGAYAFDLLEPQAYVVALLPRSGVGVMLSREILIRGGESVRHDFGQADGTIAGHVEGCASGALIGDVVVRARLKGKGGSNEPLDVTAAILQVLAAELGRTEARAGLDGDFAFRKLPPGEYVLEAAGKIWRRSGWTIVTVPSEEARSATVCVTPAAMISGRVQTVTGQVPVALSAQLYSPSMEGNVSSDPVVAGEFTLEGIAAGEYEVWLVDLNGAGRLMTVPVTLATGEHRTMHLTLGLP
jgi:hypothetical protein